MLIGVSKFGPVRFLPEKNSQTEKKKETRNRIGTGPNRPVPVRFRSSFLSKKPDKPIAYFGLFNRLFNGLCNGLLMDFY